MEVTVTTPGFEDSINLPDIDDLLTYLSQEMLVRIARRTPVDTGRAQRGWHLEGHDIVNDVDYVQYLEYGWSKQAPNGMVRVTLEEAPQIVDDYLQQHKP